MKTATKAQMLIRLPDGTIHEVTNRKVIVNENDYKDDFSAVTDSYKIVQHQKVYTTVEDVVSEQNLKANIKPNSTYDGNGGRLHIEVTFEDIFLDVENNGIHAQLYCTYDNSYDGSTGLRLSVGAKRGKSVMWIIGSRYYHKHTKSVSVAAFEEKLEKGINNFQTKIKKHFMDMFNTPSNEAQAINALESCESVKGVSYKKYVLPIITKVERASITNKWQLYCIICDEISELASSIDVRDKHLRAIITKVHKIIPSI